MRIFGLWLSQMAAEANARKQYEDLIMRRKLDMNKFTEDGSPMRLGEEPKGIDKVLAERRSTYGDYSNNAIITQGIMSMLMTGENAGALNEMHKEGLHMIAHKMSRIVNGDPNLHDSWDDIIGYARCVVDRIPNRPVKS